MKHKLLSVLTALLALLCIGCENRQAVPASVSQSDAFPVTVNGITFETSPESVVSLSPFITDIVCDIGAQDKLVMVCDYCECECKNTAGSPISPDIDKIIAASPQLVLVQTPLCAADKSALENAKITVMELKSPISLQTLENLYASMLAILCPYDDFQSKAQALMSPLYDLTENANFGEKNVVCVVSEHMNTAGKNTLCDDLISKLATNAVSSDGYESVLDETSAQNADMIFADISLENSDISRFVGDTPVYYIDFSPLEAPSVDGLCELFNQMCEFF